VRKLIINILILVLFTIGVYYLSLPLISGRLTAKAAALESQFRYQSAEPLYKCAVKLEPLDAAHYHNLAEFYLRSNYFTRRPETLRLFVQAGILNPASADIQNSFSDYFIKSGDLAGSEIRLKQALSLDPNNAAIRLKLCYFYLQNNESEQSREQFKLAFVALPAVWSYQLLQNKDIAPEYIDIAISGIEEHLKFHPSIDDAALYRGLGSLYHRKGMTTEAIAAFRKALTLRNNDLWLHMDLSYALESAADIPGAIKEANAAVKIDPNSYHAVSRLIYLYNKADMAVDAAATYKAAIRLRPNDEQLRLDFVKFLLRNGLQEEAVKEARSAVYNFPMNTDILYQLIQAYKSAGKYQLAMIELQRLISINPNNKQFQEELAKLYTLK